MIDPALELELRAHDAELERRGLAIWIGGEPTFTDRFLTTPEWTIAATGDDKAERGERVLARMAARAPGAVVLRTEGRRYPGEDAPRWSKGVYARRDGVELWQGPPDPAAGGRPSEVGAIARFREQIAHVGGDVGVHEASGVTSLVMPARETVPAFLAMLDDISMCARGAGLAGLVLEGAPPPVDASVWWTTLTPDPGVLEVNLAPATGVAELTHEIARLYQDAEASGLSPHRLHFNGDIADSGGGGHLTIGGPGLEQSPFARVPALLPRLVAYFVRHPSLSYLFGDQAGSSSQSPRVDETSRESLGELALALQLLARAKEPSLETTWRSLAPFLTDRFGNTHRCEINVEKLANPYLPGRGRLGVVELRAFRMPETPERWAAIAALLRAIVARLSVAEASIDVVTWSTSDLHDRFALPFFQRSDLRAVLEDLAAHGFALGPGIVEHLLRDRHRVVAVVDLPGASLVVRRATEFWPLVGDLSSQDGTSRLVDPSCRRLELTLRPAGEATGWTLAVERVRAPVAIERDDRGDVLVLGVRSREFVPDIGLHPLLPARDRIEIVAAHPAHGARRVTLHSWRPQGGVYPGLPASTADADARRHERVCVEDVSYEDVEAMPYAPGPAVGACSLDLRWLSALAVGRPAVSDA